MTRTSVFHVALLLGGILVSPFVETTLTATYLDQMQGTSFSSLKNSNYTYYIVAPDDEDGVGPVFTPETVSYLKQQGKVILAYIGVGVVGSWQDFWQNSWRDNPPAWLDAEIPEWPGVFRIRYWMPEAQAIIVNYMKTHILNKGFSGIFMDGVDSYADYQEQGRTTAAQEMVRYVAQLRRETETLRTGMLIFPLNAEELYEFSEYRNLVDGFGIESTWTDGDVMQDVQHTTETLKYLRMAKADRKVILSMDYPMQNANVCNYYQKCFAEGFNCAVFDNLLTGIVRSC